MATSAQVRDEILAGKWDETLGALYVPPQHKS